MAVLIILILVFLGLCFGSFVNAFVWRFHEQAEVRDRRFELMAKQASAKKPSKKAAAELEKLDGELKKLSITKGRSMCVHCHHTLEARDLVPVFSFLVLRGKCRYCRQPIPDTPLAEAVTPLLFVLSYLAWPFGFHGAGLFQFVLWLAFLVGFVALALYDLKWQELPHDIVFSLAALAALQAIVLAFGFHGSADSLVRTALGVIIICGLFCGLYLVSPKFPPEAEDSVLDDEDGEVGYGWGSKVFTALFGWAVRGKVSQWIGGGDIALGLLLGLLAAGPARAMLLIFLASLLGTLVAVPLLATGRATRSTHLPFGPFLIAAAVIVVLFGSSILAWYTRQVLGA